ncbi:MAG: zinc ribbon domain-containing protein [Deltaproteobacteria bacterium]|nr:zinc ribbon domain-containing protein [Deltaproteobacteria bacterium]
MFLIAGVSPKTKILDNNPRMCPVCGLTRAYFKRVDQYLSIFFIPILRVKKGEPFIMCERCEKNVGNYGENDNSWSCGQDIKCKNCGKTLDKNFKYCPFCGKLNL